MKIEDLKVPAISMSGAAFGLSVSEFISEFVARASGQAGWTKFGVKAGIKTLFALLFYGIASWARGLWSVLFEIATYGSLGSIVPDALYAMWPGGIPGLAEKLAVQVRGAARASKDIQKELADIESGAGGQAITTRT